MNKKPVPKQKLNLNKHNNNNYKQPKYILGLLQTPSDAETSKSMTGASSSDYAQTYPANTSSSETRLSRPCTPALNRMGTNAVHLNEKTPASSCSGRGLTPYGRRATTPNTTSSSCAVSNDISSCAIVAVVEGRGHAQGEVGITSLDLTQSVLTLSQFSDSQTYPKTLSKLQYINPKEIILPNTVCETGNNSKLFSQIKKQFPNIQITSVHRRYFNESKGIYYIKHLCAAEYKNIEIQISTKYYCLATTAALLKYTEFIQNIIFASNSLKAVFKGCEHTTMIDSTTVKNLELLQNSKNPMSQNSLFGILNYTKTPGGGRLLRSNVLQPCNDEDTIRLRQEAVLELTEKEDLFHNVQSLISKFVDIGHIVSICVQIPKQETVRTAESKLNCVILLKHVLQLIEPFRESLSYFENNLMKMFCKDLADDTFHKILDKIAQVITEETHFQRGLLQQLTQKCFAVKPQINGLLDVARRTYSELIDDLNNIVQQLAENYKLPLRTSYSSLRGFHIQMSASGASSADNLPPIFIKVNKFKNTLSFTTVDVIQQNERIKMALDEVYTMANAVVCNLLADIREHISCLYYLSDAVSMVDVVLAFAHAATLSSYVCPEFTDTLAIKQGVHPILQKNSTELVVANDTYASEHSNFVVITGPNMGGKSTYLRQVALLQIMAQMGSFVPAQYASFRMVDQIFSRLGSDDNMESNSSSFTLEMKETNYILQNVQDNSLVIIDELGRGTSAEEGVGICWAISENLLKTKAFTFFVTHFKQLTDLNKNYPNVANYYFEVQRTFNPEAKCEKVFYTHILSPGITPETHYGLMLAEIFAIPATVIEDAKQISFSLERLKQKNQSLDPVQMKQHAVFTLATRIIQVAKNSGMDEDSIRVYFKSLYKSYYAEIEKANKLIVSINSTNNEP